MDGVEKLVVEPHHLGRRQRLTLTAAVLALLTFTLLTGDSLTPACGQQPDHPRPTASAHPWIAPDDPRVDRLHYRVLDRTPTANDRPPAGVLPDDVQAAARRVGDVAGATLYLAVGPGFACLGANRISVYDNAYHPAAAQHSVCLLNSTIVNQGLTLTFTPEGSEDGVVVVAVPDGYNLITTPSATRLAAYPNVDALRPGPDPIYLQPPEGTLVDLRVNQDEITSFAC